MHLEILPRGRCVSVPSEIIEARKATVWFEIVTSTEGPVVVAAEITGGITNGRWNVTQAKDRNHKKHTVHG